MGGLCSKKTDPKTCSNGVPHCVLQDTRTQPSMQPCSKTNDKQPCYSEKSVSDFQTFMKKTGRQFDEGHSGHAFMNKWVPEEFDFVVINTDNTDNGMIVRYVAATDQVKLPQNKADLAAGHTSMMSKEEITASKIQKTSPVVYAGNFYVNENGRIQVLVNGSGHYLPDKEWGEKVAQMLHINKFVADPNSEARIIYGLANNMLDFEDDDGDDVIGGGDMQYFQEYNQYMQGYDDYNGYRASSQIGLDHTVYKIGYGGSYNGEYYNNHNNHGMDNALFIFSLLIILSIIAVVSCCWGTIFGYLASAKLKSLDKETEILSDQNSV